MDEKQIVGFMSYILSNQFAIMHAIGQTVGAAAGLDEKGVEKLIGSIGTKALEINKKLLPQMMKQANLDWDVDELLKDIFNGAKGGS